MQPNIGATKAILTNTGEVNVHFHQNFPTSYKINTGSYTTPVLPTTFADSAFLLPGESIELSAQRDTVIHGAGFDIEFDYTPLA